MRSTFYRVVVLESLILVSCANSAVEKSTAEKNLALTATESQQATGIVGEWEQQYACFDKNSNYKLEPEEKKASGTRLGFDWFRFNADGSCLRDKDMKFKGTYEIQEKGNAKKLVIQGGDKLRYTIAELTDKELVLGSDGAFIVFKKIK